MGGQKIRFEIFKRDKFICQYCGRTPPDVKLEVDHIMPLSQGGSDESANLLTSCWDCNRGKAGDPLGFIKIRKDLVEEMESLQEKEMQLREYQKLCEEIREREDCDLDLIDEKIRMATKEKYSLNDQGGRSFRYFLKIFPVGRIIDALDIAIGKIGTENPEKTARYAFGILHNWRRQRGRNGPQEND
jgi:hypothetical protein